MKKLKTNLLLLTFAFLQINILSQKYQIFPTIIEGGDLYINDEEVEILSEGNAFITKKNGAYQGEIRKKGYKSKYHAFFVSRIRNKIDLSKELTKLPIKDSIHKRLESNKLNMVLKTENVRRKIYPTEKGFRKGKYKEFDIGIREVKVNLNDDLIDKLLISSGYIDTNRTLFSSSYNNNLFLDATISDVTINRVYRKAESYYYPQGPYFMFVDIEVEWKLLNYYKELLFKKIILSSSGQFSYNYLKTKKDSELVMRDALQNSLLEFLNKNEVQIELSKKTEPNKENEDTLFLQKQHTFASSLNEVVKSSVTIKNSKGHGSGFFITKEGYVITNYHVIKDNEVYTVITNEGKEYDAKVVRTSRERDLALLKINTTKPILPINVSLDEEIELAQDIYVVGTPTSQDLSQTISRGIVSGIRKKDDLKLIQTDASINSGNSGGPIVNKSGELIGVVSSKLKGFGIEGVAFGIPAYEILDVLNLKFE